MSGVHRTLYVDGLSAVLDPASGGEMWSVWRGLDQVGVLELHRAGAQVWLAGRIDEDLVAEGPTVLSVLRRLACRSTTRGGTEADAPSLVRT